MKFIVKEKTNIQLKLNENKKLQNFENYFNDIITYLSNLQYFYKNYIMNLKAKLIHYNIIKDYSDFNPDLCVSQISYYLIDIEILQRN